MFGQGENKGCRGGASVLRRVLSLLLCLCLLLSEMTVLVSAAETDTGVQKKNTYLMRVQTGVNSGESIEYLAIRYLDDAGKVRVHFLFPQDGSYTESCTEAVKAGGYRNKSDMVSRAAHYVSKGGNRTTGLARYSCDEYIFTPMYPFRELVSVDVYAHYTESARPWVCEGIELFRLDTLYGVGMSGYFSDDTYVDFSGKLLWSMKETITFNFDKSDKLFRIGTNPAEDTYSFEKYDGEDGYSTHEQDSFIFEIKIADLYGSGIESLEIPATYAELTLGSYSFPELLVLEVTYTDDAGGQRTVKMPVIANTLAWGEENGLISAGGHYIGIAQQGENLVFAGQLPRFQNLTECKLYYGTDADEQAGIRFEGNYLWDGSIIDLDEAKSKINANADRLDILGLRMYRTDGDPADIVRYDGSGTDIRFAVDASPMYIFTAPTVNGEAISLGSEKKLKMVEYVKGSSMEPKQNLQGRYVVVVETDDVTSADTVDDIQYSIHYKGTDGVERSTSPIVLRDAIRNFYGSWAGRDEADKAADFSYNYAVSQGGKAAFIVDLNGVSQFTAIEFSMGSMSRDDWQVKSVTIYKPQSIDNREVRWEHLLLDGSMTDRLITRDFDDSVIMRRYGDEKRGETPVYLYGENLETAKCILQFDPSSAVVSETEIDWSDIRYSMTYKQAKQDLGFAKVRATYDVGVKVAGNESATNENGDTGSKNLFYFQLVFETGTSAYVLANQQLTADGFRAGKTETFQIKTNQNYGELSAVRIIPDDISDTANSDIFDKLKIDTISVTKKSGSGMELTWKVENVGWIEIDYRDEGGKNTAGGQKGRAVEEMVRDFPVTSAGYSSNILFMISTGPYAKAVMVGVDAQPTGTITATIEYEDSASAVQTMDVDIVRAMYEYNGKTPRYSAEETYLDDADAVVQCAEIDTKHMLRGAHEDRFLISMQDVKHIRSMTLKVRGTNTTDWNINKISVYQINGEGKLRLNAQGEYQRHSAEELTYITASTEDGYALHFNANGAENTQLIRFADNTITVEKDKSEWTSRITPVPENKNDTLNLYVYTRRDGTESPMSAYTLDAAIQYSCSENASARKLSVQDMNRSEEKGMFYAVGLNVFGFTNLGSLTLHAQAVEEIRASIEYAVIQHVRSGVVIGNYYMDFSGDNVENAIVIEPSGGMDRIPEAEQQVSLYFTENTVSGVLSYAERDIAAALRYTTIHDVTNREYSSPYVYLAGGTASDEAIYNSIYPGMIAQLTFHEPFVKEITGITVASVGSLTASVDSAIVSDYTVSGNAYQWNSTSYFADEQVLSHIPHTMQASETNVVPVELVLETAPSREDVDTGTDDPIRMVIQYTDQTGAMEKTRIIDNLGTYLVGGSFHAGDTAVVSLCMKDLGQIRTITLEPYSDDVYSKAVWGLKRITLRMTQNGGASGASDTVSMERTFPDTLIMEGQPKLVNLSNILITTTTSYYNSKMREYNSVNSDANGTVQVLVSSEDEVVIRTYVDGTLPGYSFGVSAVRVRDGAETVVTCFERSGNQVVFKTPANTSGADDVYRVIIRSEEAPAIKAIVEIRVESVSDSGQSGEGALPEEETQSGEELPAKEDGESGEASEKSSGTDTGDATGEETGEKSEDKPDDNPEDKPETKPEESSGEEPVKDEPVTEEPVIEEPVTEELPAAEPEEPSYEPPKETEAETEETIPEPQKEPEPVPEEPAAETGTEPIPEETAPTEALSAPEPETPETPEPTPDETDGV